MSRSFPIERRSLANGLRVVIQRDPALPLVAVNLWYHVGSKDEAPGRTGFAHLFEHMLFQGSEHVGTNDHFAHLQQVGGVANGSTWYDRTNYYETLPSQHLELGLWLESDRMGFLLPAMTEEKLETQRGVVLNERRERVDNQPYGRAWERVHELLYPEGHPYRWPVIGYVEDIERMALEDVEGFFSTYYVPGNAVLTLAGDIEPERGFELAERYFGDIPAGPHGDAMPRVSAPFAPVPAESRETLPDRIALTRFYMAFRTPGILDPSWHAGDLLSSVLSGGKSSPMYADLVLDRQLAQDIGAYVYPTELEAPWVLVGTARPGVEIERLEAAAFEHITRAAEKPPETAELERAKNRVLTGFHEDLQALDERADLLGQFTTFHDDPDRLASEPERYESLSGEALRDFAAEHLRPEARVVVTVVPVVPATGSAPDGAAS